MEGRLFSGAHWLAEISFQRTFVVVYLGRRIESDAQALGRAANRRAGNSIRGGACRRLVCPTFPFSTEACWKPSSLPTPSSGSFLFCSPVDALYRYSEWQSNQENALF